MSAQYYEGIGRRKESTARVRDHAAVPERVGPGFGALVDHDQERAAIFRAAGGFDAAPG